MARIQNQLKIVTRKCNGKFSVTGIRKFSITIKKISEKSVLVLDRATYHTHLLDEDRKPTA